MPDVMSCSMSELPPCTWRIQAFSSGSETMQGTTSAHAENTPVRSTTVRVAWNYLRARGEYHLANPPGDPTVELPPRTRRIPKLSIELAKWSRTTSAHAENTRALTSLVLFHENYLRARGEYYQAAVRSSCCSELPPRTRRIRPERQKGNHQNGTTSAHAENTENYHYFDTYFGNYLRARGEYLANGHNRGLIGGTTSAHAENTPTLKSFVYRQWNYLRARGEYTDRINYSSRASELPPRTRRILPDPRKHPSC